MTKTIGNRAGGERKAALAAAHRQSEPARLRLSPEDVQARAKVLKALGHPTRLQILDLLDQGDLCLCEFNPLFKIRQPTATDDGSRLLYKQAIRGMLPDEILYRKKARGFSHPTSVWFRTTLKDFLRDTVLSPNAHILNYLNASYVRHVVTQHLEGAANFDYHLNSLLILECWLKAFLRP